MPNTRSKFSKSPIRRALWIALILAGVPVCPAQAAPSSRAADALAASPSPKIYEVAEVLTGDTFRLTTGTVVAYSSVAAPPLVHKDAKVREYGKQSLEFNRALLQGKRVRIEFGSRIKNGDGVYQAFVFLEDNTFANLKVLEAGFAKLNIVPPNLQFADELRRAAQRARKRGEGLWEHENKIDHKLMFVADKMTRKYHIDGCSLLDGVSKAHLEHFDSSVSAKAAGYTFCKDCRNTYAQKTDLF